MKRKLELALTVIAMAVSAVSSVAQKPTMSSDVLLTVGGKVEHPLNLTRGDLDKYSRQSVKAKSRDGKEHIYEGVAVGALLLKAGVKFGESLHMEAAASYLLAEAADGYRVVFALPEFDSPPNDRLILIADRVDGTPLPTATGPLQMVVSGDKGHGRWVRQLKSLTIQVAPSK